MILTAEKNKAFGETHTHSKLLGKGGECKAVSKRSVKKQNQTTTNKEQLKKKNTEPALYLFWGAP